MSSQINQHLFTTFGLVAKNPEVYYGKTKGGVANADLVESLKVAAAALPRHRCRVCFHDNPGAPVHEMLIVHHRNCYVRPHRHLRNPESLTVIEGSANLLLFDDNGDVTNNMRLEGVGNTHPFYCHIPIGTWHSLVIQSEWLVFFEVVQGPFDPNCSEFSSWSPMGDLKVDVPEYAAKLEAEIYR